jgi:hypothetical protein
LVIRELLHLALQPVDALDERLNALDLALVTCAENLG